MSGKSLNRLGAILSLIFRSCLFLAGTVILTLISYRIFPREADIHWYGVEAMATVKYVTVGHSKFSPLPFYKVSYRFKVEGQAYTGRGQFQTLVTPGDLITIKYLPKNPKRSFVAGSINFIPVLISICAALVCLNSMFICVYHVVKVTTEPPAAPSVVIVPPPPIPSEKTIIMMANPNVMPSAKRHPLLEEVEK